MIFTWAIIDLNNNVVKGDLLHYLESEAGYGRKEGFANAISNGAFVDWEDHRDNSPFVYLDLPLVTERDCDEIRDTINYADVDGEAVATGRTYKIDFESLENRELGSFYGNKDGGNTKLKYSSVLNGRIRRDTLNAYLEILRDDVVIGDIRVVR